ncbi:MAG TPA: dihydrofolate reductase family protein, partial [Terriglobia bacterium]|nr:dihydrofolate reductase family protein [Terriglobia bacterium]
RLPGNDMVQAAVFIATSVDGFIARPDGGLDWLPEGGGFEGEDYGYDAFIKSIDAIIMGRHSFEKVCEFPEWPYRKPVIVLTSRSRLKAPHPEVEIETMRGAPGEILSTLEKQGIRSVYVDGGKTIQQFLDAGVVNRLIVTRIPVLIGQGIPLFGPLTHDIVLEHVVTRSWPSGLTQSEYVVRDSHSRR